MVEVLSFGLRLGSSRLQTEGSGSAVYFDIVKERLHTSGRVVRNGKMKLA